LPFAIAIASAIASAIACMAKRRSTTGGVC
jgi:hypothetical protein